MIEAARLLVVSRESAGLRPLWSIAEPNFWHVETAASAWDAIERVQSGRAPHLLLLDVPGGDSDSLHILRWMRRLRPDLPVIVMCASEDASLRREATRLGAREVLIKPIDEARLAAAIHPHLVFPEDEGTEMASEDIEQLGPDSFFVSASPITQNLRAQVELLAEVDVPVLILGERGSGKDTVARLIHKLSVRSGFEFLKVNCADMPGDLLGAELFGSERSSSASSSRIARGKIERAEKGTIFLDEITEMPLGLQARLMQILQEKVLPGQGHAPAVPVDVRILASTSVSIERALAERKLREDLYYRLSAFTVQVPALRQRRSEIPILLQHSMHQLARHYGLPPREFASGALAACQNYSWPGNLKELESFVKRYLVAGDTEFTFNDLNSNLASSTQAGPVAGSTRMIPPPTWKSGQPEHSGRESLKSLIQNVKWEAERNAIGIALQKTGWNRKAAARLLQVSYRTLLYKIEQYHMSASEPFLSPLPAAKLSFQGTTTRSSGKGE
ncbi:MAG TPA: sigma-54 dependent transcriptional regulator [Candidatus Dormibacteraeota bacterium]|nr:sigma-54 dependent transcriptional regulator [Candidatus Dormibacteraeota bacterium]